MSLRKTRLLASINKEGLYGVDLGEDSYLIYLKKLQEILEEYKLSYELSNIDHDNYRNLEISVNMNTHILKLN